MIHPKYTVPCLLLVVSNGTEINEHHFYTQRFFSFLKKKKKRTDRYPVSLYYVRKRDFIFVISYAKQSVLVLLWIFLKGRDTRTMLQHIEMSSNNNNNKKKDFQSWNPVNWAGFCIPSGRRGLLVGTHILKNDCAVADGGSWHFKHNKTTRDPYRSSEERSDRSAGLFFLFSHPRRREMRKYELKNGPIFIEFPPAGRNHRRVKQFRLCCPNEEFQLLSIPRAFIKALIADEFNGKIISIEKGSTFSFLMYKTCTVF